MGLFKFAGDEQFGRVDCSILGYQMLVGRDAGDPRHAGGVFLIEHELVRGEARSLRSAERCHDNDELFVDDSGSSRNGRVGQRNGLCDRERTGSRCRDLGRGSAGGVGFSARIARHTIARRFIEPRDFGNCGRDGQNRNGQKDGEEQVDGSQTKISCGLIIAKAIGKNGNWGENPCWLGDSGYHCVVQALRHFFARHEEVISNGSGSG